MDFVRVMLFTQQVFHLECYFSFDSFWYLGLLLLNLSQVFLTKVLFIWKKHVLVLQKWRNNFATWVYLCLHLVFQWDDVVWKVLPIGAFRKNIKRVCGGDHIGGMSIERGFKPNYDLPTGRTILPSNDTLWETV